MTENERRHSERQRRICHRGGEKRKISSKWQIYHAGACNHYSWSGIHDLRNLAWCIIYVFYLMPDMGCNAVNFSSKINEEIKLKNKKIFIGVYKTWMRYAAWFDEIKWTAGYYDKIRKHVYIDYEKSYDYAELICAFCGGVSYNRNDYVSESYHSFLIRMGENWVWYTILLRHGKEYLSSTGVWWWDCFCRQNRFL